MMLFLLIFAVSAGLLYFLQILIALGRMSCSEFASKWHFLSWLIPFYGPLVDIKRKYMALPDWTKGE